MTAKEAAMIRSLLKSHPVITSPQIADKLLASLVEAEKEGFEPSKAEDGSTIPNADKSVFDCDQCGDGDALRTDEECAYCGEGGE